MIVTGALAADSGRVTIDGKDPSDQASSIGYMPQDLGLWATLNVTQQLRLMLHSRRRLYRTIKDLQAAAEEIGLSGRLKAFPAELSGGELRRLSFLRTMVIDSRLLVLDEPFSSVDSATQAVMQRKLRTYHEKTGCAVLLITHEFEQALLLANRAAVLHNGRIIQSGPPRDLCDNPIHGSVERVIGATNLWPARLSSDNGWIETPLGKCRMPKSPGPLAGNPQLVYSVPVESLRLAEGAPGISGTVESAITGQRALLVFLRHNKDALLEFSLPLTSDTLAAIRPGKYVSISWDHEAARILED
jgi:ABC-type Fe3+/spermidine/putrescine transport system ATPase subunit